MPLSRICDTLLLAMQIGRLFWRSKLTIGKVLDLFPEEVIRNVRKISILGGQLTCTTVKNWKQRMMLKLRDVVPFHLEDYSES